VTEHTSVGKDGAVLGVGDIVDVCYADGDVGRATIMSIDENMDNKEIRIFDAWVLWHSGSTGLASIALMTLVSKARSN